MAAKHSSQKKKGIENLQDLVEPYMFHTRRRVFTAYNVEFMLGKSLKTH